MAHEVRPNTACTRRRSSYREAPLVNAGRYPDTIMLPLTGKSPQTAPDPAVCAG